MLKAGSKEHYLSAMGIVQWRERNPVQIIPVVGYQLQHKANLARCGLLFACFSEADEKRLAEETLVAKIIQAIHLEACVDKIEVADGIFSPNVSDQFVIMLGVDLCLHKQHPGLYVIKSHSAAELLANPNLKRETWQQLQPIVTLYKNKE